ncbi:MAG: ABC transporter permease [Spirochaeta sp.]
MKRWGTLHGMLLLLILWYIAAALIQSPIVPVPHRVLLPALQELPQPATLLHIASSLYRIICGILLALLFGIPAGIISGRSRLLDGIISPLLYLLYPIPKIAFLPVFMVILGIGDISKIALITVIIFFPITVFIRDGVQRISQTYIELAMVLSLSQKEILRSIIFPGILPDIFSAIRISLGISLSVLFFSENIAASHGLGFMIMNSWIMAHYTGMYAGIVYLSLLGILLYRLLDRIEISLTPWTRQ